MKTILITAYAVNPYKGSEDGTGWNILRQIAMRNRIILITRKNNREAIEKYQKEHPESWHQQASFLYFDLPSWARFWKKGARGALPYYWLWQLRLPAFIRKQSLSFDIAHQLNFHNDWLPTVLWRLKKPVVWGPVGHHDPVPANYLLPTYGRKAWWQDRRRHWIKSTARRLNPLYAMALRKTDRILAISQKGQEKINFPQNKTTYIPAVGAKLPALSQAKAEQFTVLSIGRFVPLKGFDLTIRSFARFAARIPEEQRKKLRLCLVGKGPEKERLQSLAKESGCGPLIDFIEWMPREELCELYQQAHVFLFPSHEGAGMVVPEALSYGLPVICFDNAGPGELVNEKCAVRIPHAAYKPTVKAFSHALEALYADAPLRQQMAKAARTHVEETLTWQAKGLKIQAIYDSIPLS